MNLVIATSILFSVLMPLLLLPFSEVLSQAMGRTRYEVSWLLYFMPVMQCWYVLILIGAAYYYRHQWQVVRHLKARKHPRLIPAIISRSLLFFVIFWAIYFPAEYSVFFRFNWLSMLQNLLR